MLVVLCAGFVLALVWVGNAQAQQAFDRQWGGGYTPQDWTRFYHYPYVYYPQNFWGSDYYRSSENPLLSLSAGDANPSLQPRLAQRVSAAPPLLPGSRFHPRRVLRVFSGPASGFRVHKGTLDPDRVSCETAAKGTGYPPSRRPAGARTMGTVPFPLPGAHPWGHVVDHAGPRT